MLKKIRGLFHKKGHLDSKPLADHKIILTSACLSAIQKCLARNAQREHEGIVYLLGQVLETKTIAIVPYCPKARTTFGSFNVTSREMAQVIRVANQLSLQVVGQVHTHPGDAFHSDGDEDGANIAYEGYISIVLPRYGKRLPSLEGAAYFVFGKGNRFIELDKGNVTIVPEVLK